MELTVNGMAVRVETEPGARLIDLLRDTLNLTGTKEGCGEGECGACTVLVDGRAVNACLFPALEADGRSVTTIEGLAGRGGELSAVQRAFVEHGGIQCGFCSPGMILAATALLGENPDPTNAEIRQALVGNLCRCTGYVQIVDSVRHAAAALRAVKEG
jgi:carbon-monoxide dehydrogenase small subunit